MTELTSILSENAEQLTAYTDGAVASELLSLLMAVDGSGSGLDADKLDGQEASAFSPATSGSDILKGDGSGGTSPACGADIVSLLGVTAVNRATADGSGNNIMSTYAPVSSPALCGTPTAPTAQAGAADSQLATTAFVNSAITQSWYQGVDLTTVFASEISEHADVWAWIKARIQVGNYSGLHISDYIPFTTTNGVSLKACIAGIDTYTGYGEVPIGHHIDFISRELWPTLKAVNPVNYNNGLIPVDLLTSDGVTTSYTLANPINAIESITLAGEALNGYTYDRETQTVSFQNAPPAGSIKVTGVGTQHPWLACDLYHWLNSLSGQVPNGAVLNPLVVRVDYSADGVYYYLPQSLKSAIVEKHLFLEWRYSSSGLLSVTNNKGWANLGKLWLPTEFEVYGGDVWAGSCYNTAGCGVQYPTFVHNMNRVKMLSGNRAYWWLLNAYNGNSTEWCYVSASGYAYSGSLRSRLAVPVCFRIA